MYPGYALKFSSERPRDTAIARGAEDSIRSLRGARVHQIGVMFLNNHFGSADTVMGAAKSDMKALLAMRFVNSCPVSEVVITYGSCPSE